MSAEKPHSILMVDDEPNALSGYQRTVGRKYPLKIAEGGAAALALLQSDGPFAVVITDMRMPKMTGLEFIEAARATAKETVFMMLTGNADQQTAVQAINRGHIFRFLNKPCTPELLDHAIRAGLRQYELITAERILLRDTFAGSVNLLSEALELANPYLAAMQTTVKRVHTDLCTALGIHKDWQLTVASTLCLIGLVTVPGLKHDSPVSDETLELAATLGHRLIKHLPRLGSVAEMILHQRELGPLPMDLKSSTPQAVELIGARLLRICVDVAREYRKTNSMPLAVEALKTAGIYDRRFIAALEGNALTAGIGADIVLKDVTTENLEPGMQVNLDIIDCDGMLVLSHGQQLSDLSVASLRNYAKRGIIKNTVSVRVNIGLPKAA